MIDKLVQRSVYIVSVAFIKRYQTRNTILEEDSIMLDRLYLIKLIDQLRNFEGSEEDEAVFFEKLENLVTDPNISDYIYWTNMSSEEIADKVLSYKPIILPDLSNSQST